MMKCSETQRLGLMLGVAAGIGTDAAGQIVTSDTGYTCSNFFCTPLTNNLSLDVTLRSVTCGLPTSMAQWYDLSSNPVFTGIYSTLKCVDFSIWSSSNPGDQVFTIRVYQDLTPESRSPVCPSQGLGSTNEPGPDVASQLLLWEEVTIFPPSLEGVDSLADARSDGDRSIE